MKIGRDQLKEAFLDAVSNRYQAVPPENEIEHTFSPEFQSEIHKMSRKSESTLWRGWQSPVKRAIAVAGLILIMLTVIACASPTVREAILSIFLIDEDKGYGITFNPEKAENAPDEIEDYWIPDYCPKDFAITYQVTSQTAVTYIWQRENRDLIRYSQLPIQEGTTEENWMGINSEGARHTTESINGYLVEMLAWNEHFVAIWTDNQYIYMVEIRGDDIDTKEIVTSIMSSLVCVDSVD